MRSKNLPAQFFLLSLLLLIGVAARISLFGERGYAADLQWFANWSRVAYADGLAALYDNTDVNYPPLYVLVLWFCAAAADWFGLTSDVAMHAVLRVPPMLADVAIALVLYRFVKHYANTSAARLAAAIYFLNPAVIYVTAYWGQVDSVHTLFLLLALVACSRRSGWGVGFWLGFALAQKLQSLAIVPLALIEVFRYLRWRGLRDVAGGFLLAVVIVLAPFLAAGTVDDALQRGYRQVVGQYPQCSVEAYNLWCLLGLHEARDNAPPPSVVRFLAGDADSIAVEDPWAARLTVRRISLVLFALCVATILAIHLQSQRHDARFLAGGALALAFFVLPTEMHERYLFPAIALLAVWAVVVPQRLAVYALLSALFLVNLVGVLAIDPVRGHVGGAMVLALLVLIGWQLFQRPVVGDADDARKAEPPVDPRAFDDPLLQPVRWPRLFQALTLVVLLATVGAAAPFGLFMVREQTLGRSTGERATAQTQPLSALEPDSVRVGYGALQRQREVTRGPLLLGGRYFADGVGVHAPARVTYDVPAGYDRFRATVGVDGGFDGMALLEVFLDRRKVYQSPVLTRGVPHTLDLDLNGARRITFAVDPRGRNTDDHVNLAAARFERSSSTPTSQPTPNTQPNE